MKHLSLILFVMAFVVGIQRVEAEGETVSPYSADFNTTITTTDPAFRVSTGWSHVAEGVNGYYMQYAYSTNKGVDGTGALRCSYQKVTYYDYSTSGYKQQEVNDLLVTPAVSGNVTIQSQRYYYSHSLIFFKMTKNADGTFTMGDTLTVNDGNRDTTVVSGLSSSSYSTITIGNFSEPTYIGIRANGVYLDNFSAESATIEKVRELKVQVVTVLNKTPDTREDGTFPVTVSLKVDNNGDLPLAPGDENYSYTLLTADGNTEVSTVPANISLAVSATAVDTVSFSANYADYPDTTVFKIRENITGNIYQYQPWNERIWVDPIPYKPIYDVYIDNASVADNATLNFRKILKSTTKDVIVKNAGAKNLTVTNVTATGDFSIDKTSFTVAPHASDTIKVTALAGTAGNHDGMLVIKADELSDFHINLSAMVIDSTKYFVDFEDNKLPEGSYQEGNWTTYSWGIGDNKYVLRHTSIMYDNKFITPKLHAAASDSLQVDVARQVDTERNFDNSFLKVYYSSDRNHWTLLDSISTDRMSNEIVHNDNYNPKYALKTFTINGIPEGDWYFAFGSGCAIIDNIYGLTKVPVAHDVRVSYISFPNSGTVNSKYQGTVNLINNLHDTEVADNYTGSFHLGEDSVAIASKDLIQNTSTKFEVAAAPHKAGTLPAYAVFTFADGYTVSTDTVYVEIAPEVASAEVQIGEAETTTGYAPLKLNYYNSETETVYDTALLSGLANGAKITGITYKGYRSSKDMSATLNVWIANTADSAAASVSAYTMANTDTMTNVYSGDYTYPSGGTNASHIDIVTVNFPQPFTYTGQNLRVIVRSENANAYQSTDFENTNDKTHTYGRYKDKHDDFLTASYSAVNTPVMYLSVEKSPTTFTGSVVNEENAPVGGAAVTITSGLVQYSDTTAADGTFSIEVMKDQLQYTAKVIAAGYEPYEDSVDVLQPATLVLKPATGLFLKGSNIPATATVNSPYAADATVMNDIATAIAKDGYTAELYVDGNVVATSPAEELASLETRKYSFAFTPHAAGTFPATIHFTYGGTTYATDTVQLTVAPEDFGKEYTACDSAMVYMNANPAAPWNNYNKFSQSVIVYTPDQIRLEAGSKITRIRFRGRINGNTPVGKEAANMFIANTTLSATDTASAHALLRDTASMVRLLNAETDSISYGGEGSWDIHDLIDITIPGGFVYTGGNIVVVFDGNHYGMSDNKTHFISDIYDTHAQAWGRQTDSNGKISVQAFKQVTRMPVMYMTVDKKKTVSGKVVRLSGDPMAVASLTLKSGDVEYYATSDSTGSYSIDLAKGTLTYSLTATKDGFKPGVVKDISFADSDEVVANDTLLAYVSVNGTVKGKEMNPYKPAETVALAGAKVSISTADATLPEILTAADGTFRADSLVEGTEYTFAVTADGYADTTFTHTAPAANDTLDDIVLKKLVSRISLSGKVLGKEMNPYKPASTEALAGAKVTVTIDGNTLPEITTADDGSFSIDSLTESGTYTITVSADGYADTTFTYTAPAANDTLADIVLKSVVKTITATGKVYGQDADLNTYTVLDPVLLSDAIVTVVDATGATVATATTAADGTYELTLTEAGVYTITYSHEGYGDSTVTFTAGSEDATLDDVTLYTDAYTGISTIDASSKTLRGDVYTINGQFLGSDVDVKQLSRGVYIVNGKKFTVK